MVIAAAAGPASAERFAYFGTQADGAELYVQATPARDLGGDLRMAWFRSVSKEPRTVKDEHGEEHRYTEMLALNVADCRARSMGSSSLVYRDSSGLAVAKFELPPLKAEFVKVRANTLGESMYAWICAPKKAAPKTPPPAAQSPIR